MAHLLHEVKAEMDWAFRELNAAEKHLSELEVSLREFLEGDTTPEQRDTFIARIEQQKRQLNLPELYELLSRGSRRFSILTRVFEIGSRYTEIDDIVTALTDGQLFRLDITGERMEHTILEVAEALQVYFHGHFDEAADAQLREAWLKIEDSMRAMGRRI